MKRFVVQALLVALAVAAAGPAQAASERIRFTHGTDRSSWYWNKQVDEEAGAPGVPVSQRVRLRSPQNADTLPVAVQGGEHERASAIFFDLAGRGLAAGSTITKAVLTIAEKTDQDEQPGYNGEGKGIQACRIDDFWPGGDAEKWDAKPPHDESSCAEGKRRGGAKSPTWTFDLTSLAAPWGEDPFSNHGVLLMGIIPKDAGPHEAWQVNLKIPGRKDYDKTKNRALLTLAWTAGAEPSLSFDPGGVGSTDLSSDFSSGSGGDTLAPPSGPGGRSKEPSKARPPGSEEKVTAQPVAQVKPQPPWYAWLLFPLALLAWGLVRPVVMEPARGFRPDGAVAAIRRVNVERRGTALEEPAGPLLAAMVALRTSAGGMRRLAGSAGRATGRATRRILTLPGTISRTVRKR